MKPLIAANWKMNGSMDWVKKTGSFDAILPKESRGDIDVLICPPALYVGAMAVNDHGVLIGGQNCHHADSGAHTGEISAQQLKNAGASYVIVGHSERRAAGETDSDVRAKAEAAIRHGLTPIICVGETLAQREAGEEDDIVGAQLSGSCPQGASSGDLVIAYEPVWAIGTGLTATVEDIESMHGFIRVEMGGGTRILYGGSVKPDNAAEILGADNVNGALIGGAGLKMESLAAIAKAALS